MRLKGKTLAKIFLALVLLFIAAAVLSGYGALIAYILTFLAFFSISVVAMIFVLKYIQDPERVERDSKEDYFPTVSVVVPAYNEGENIRATIESILNSDYPKDKLEVIVVDDGSKDNTYEIASQYPIRVLRKPNGGAASAKNYGILHAKGDIIVTLDSDTIIDSKAIKRLASYFKDPKVGGVSGAVRVKDPKNMLEKWQAIEYDIILVYRRVLEAFESVYVTPGGLSAFRKKALMEVGLFDTRSLTEDQEIAMNLQKHGWKIRSSLDAFSYTQVPPTLSQLIKQRTRWVRGGIWNRVKHLDLLNWKWGDFMVFSYWLDFIFFFQILPLSISFILFLVENNFWFFRLGTDAVVFGFGPITFIGIFFWMAMLPWFVYYVNLMREKAHNVKISLKEIVDVLGFLFIFSVGWVIVWPFVFYKELLSKEEVWETR
ncbi:MAG: glycosyltransferase family 2 protein [Candidatus Micrarchaeota archaeon]|nr:glycosyltransferase family 2 protein [Candidatus Micrarchaeota archaeon]